MKLLHPAEPPVVTIVNPNAHSEWLLTCDHAGNGIPMALGTLGLTADDLERHIAWDIGAAGLTAALAERLDAVAVLQRYSRLVIDCNRPPGAASSVPTRSENTDIPGNIGLSAAEIACRREEIFAPYHAAIAAVLDARAAAGRRTILVTMHSFTPVYDGQVRPMHAAVLYNRQTRLAHALLAVLRADPDLVVGDNDPYSVSDESDYGINVHGEQRGLPCVELEVRQDLIADAAGQAAWAARLARLLPAAALVAGV